jgi:hypothetical protein
MVVLCYFVPEYLFNRCLFLCLWELVHLVEDDNEMIAGDFPDNQALGCLGLHAFRHIDNQHHQVNNLGTFEYNISNHYTYTDSSCILVNTHITAASSDGKICFYVVVCISTSCRSISLQAKTHICFKTGITYVREI